MQDGDRIIAIEGIVSGEETADRGVLGRWDSRIWFYRRWRRFRGLGIGLLITAGVVFVGEVVSAAWIGTRIAGLPPIACSSFGAYFFGMASRYRAWYEQARDEPNEQD